MPAKPSYIPVRSTTDWSQTLREAVTDPEALLRLVGVAADEVDFEPGFPLRVPHPFIERMHKGDPEDPLLRQVLPLKTENVVVTGYTPDPLEEAGAMRDTGIVQKYAHRALLITTPVCAVNCRYCFRRAFPYDAQRLRITPEALETVVQDSSLTEIILSGGDPLVLTDRQFSELAALLAEIPHLKRLRVHTRLPVVIPDRVTDALIATLSSNRLQPVVVLHINHGNEIDDAVAHATRRLRDAGITLLNQSVLLRGVNDCPEALAALSETLIEAGVLPYYVHLPDAVAGTHHFHVSDERAAELDAALRRRLPGYLVPRFAREVPGADAKVW